MEWFYRGVLGIDQSKSSIAYKEIKINPAVVGNLISAKGSYECIYGTISTEWKKEKKSFQLKLEIPANTTAVVYLPAKRTSKILEGNNLVRNEKEIKWLGFEKGKLKLKVGSGSYSFVVKDDQ